ncbi:hypothetical protein ACWFRF_20860 [Nocardia sp. NPDC055165]
MSVFEIPPPAGQLKINRFEFKLGAKTVSLPKLEFLPPEGEEFIDKAAITPMSNRDYFLGLVDAIGEAEAEDAAIGKTLRRMRLHRDQLTALHTAWKDSSKVDEGESSASDAS